MRKDRVWMKFKKEDFNQLMGVLSKQMERYSEIEAQNLNLKADIKDEKESRWRNVRKNSITAITRNISYGSKS